MSIILTSRPYGHRLDTTITYTGSLTMFASKVAVTTPIPHGLTSGQWIYVQSPVAEYNGFKYVDVGNATQFTFSDNGPHSDGGVEHVDWIQDAPVTYQISAGEHGVNAVHNPIVYELFSNVYPNNGAGDSYYPATVVSQSNAEGYTKLTLSGNVFNVGNFTVDANEGTWITIGEDGPYQITTKISDSIIVINLTYDAAKVWSGPVVKYFTNYVINVNIYVGFEAGHPWAYLKPFVLASTLQLTPNAQGYVKFSISEVVRSFITTRNRPDLGTLPNNTDFAAQFFIEYYESWDQSDGNEIYRYETVPVPDSSHFIGLAINAMMPFKSIGAGAMDDYVGIGTMPAKWLTLQDRITWIKDQYFDISFILYNYVHTSIQSYVNGELVATITDPGDGVIRVPVLFDTEGEKCLQLSVPPIPARGFEPIVLSNMFCACGCTWTLGANPTVVVNPSANSGYLTLSFDGFPGRPYTFEYSILVEHVSGSGTHIQGIRVLLMDSDCDIHAEESDSSFNTGVKTGTVVLTPTVFASTVAIKVTNISTIPVARFTVQSFNLIGAPAIEAQPITEMICIDVVDQCDSTFIPDDNIRLLEDGDFRILE